MNINSIRGKKLELLAFLDFHQPHVVAIHTVLLQLQNSSRKLAHIVYIEKTEISMVAGSCCSSICLSQNWKTTRNQFGLKYLQTKLLILWQVGIDHLVALVKNSNYLENSFYYIRTHHKGKKLPSVHVLGDFNFKDIDWPDRLSKSGSTLSQSEGQILIDIMNDMS